MDKHSDFPLRIRYAETDQMGVAHHANYLVWFEVGRSEFCRQLGFSYREMEREAGRFLTIVEVYFHYHLPLRYEDEFLVRTRLKELRKRTVTFAYQLLDPQGYSIYAEGETKHMIVDNLGWSKGFPEEYRLLPSEE